MKTPQGIIATTSDPERVSVEEVGVSQIKCVLASILLSGCLSLSLFPQGYWCPSTNSVGFVTSGVGGILS